MIQSQIDRASPTRWLLLLQQVPSSPSSARVKVWRRLQALGAVPLRGSAYVLPDSADRREDFEWMKAEIDGIGGHASVLAADTVDASGDGEIVAAFRQARAADVQRLAREARAVLASVPAGRRVSAPARLRLARRVRRLHDGWQALEAITFFDTPGQEEVRRMLRDLQTRVSSDSGATTAGALGDRLDAAAFRRRTWVTRPRPGIDRMASAWLIRRYIDPHARFRFAERPARRAEIPFDVFGAEFSHQDQRCTFEVLATRFDIGDPAVNWIGRIVHDLDLKDERYGLPETAGVGRFVEGLRQQHADDHRLLEHGIALIESLARSVADQPVASRRGAGRPSDPPKARERARRSRGAKRTRLRKT